MKTLVVSAPKRNPLIAVVMKKGVRRHGKSRKAERRLEKTRTAAERGRWIST